MSRSAARSSHDTEAFLLRRVEYGEADLIVTLFTRSLGRISALARGARKSRRRFGGALEPFFTLKVRFEERSSADLFSLVEAKVEKARTALLSDLARMQVGGRALGWIREAAPPRTPEPRAWALIERLLDRLAEQTDRSPELELGEAGLALLSAFGWGLDLERCVRCGKQCPLTQAGSVDPKRGGLVCRACGGGRLHVRAEQRVRLSRASGGEIGVLLPDDAALAVDLVERVLVAHAGIES